jgi:hypothetical protein
VARAPGALLKGPTTKPLQQLRDRALVPIHPNAWKGNSAKFALTEFSEVAPALVTLHTGHVDQLKAGPTGSALS